MPSVTIFYGTKECARGHGFWRIQKYKQNGAKNGTTCYTCYMESKLFIRDIRQLRIAWANPEKIADTYERARLAGLHVDHIYPLRGKLISGLHVEGNLRGLSPTENRRKGNGVYEDEHVKKYRQIPFDY